MVGGPHRRNATPGSGDQSHHTPRPDLPSKAQIDRMSVPQSVIAKRDPAEQLGPDANITDHDHPMVDKCEGDNARGRSQPEKIRRAAERRSPPVGLPPPPKDHRMFAPARVQATAAGSLSSRCRSRWCRWRISLSREWACATRGPVRGPRWRIAVEARKDRPCAHHGR